MIPVLKSWWILRQSFRIVIYFEYLQLLQVNPFSKHPAPWFFVVEVIRGVRKLRLKVRTLPCFYLQWGSVTVGEVDSRLSLSLQWGSVTVRKRWTRVFGSFDVPLPGRIEHKSSFSEAQSFIHIFLFFCNVCVCFNFFLSLWEYTSVGFVLTMWYILTFYLTSLSSGEENRSGQSEDFCWDLPGYVSWEGEVHAGDP